MKPRALYSRAEPINHCSMNWRNFLQNLNWNWSRESQNDGQNMPYIYSKALVTVLVHNDKWKLTWLLFVVIHVTLPIGLLFCLHNVWACVQIDAGIDLYPYVWWILLWLCLLTDPVFLSIFVSAQVLIDPELRAVYDATGEVRGLERRGKGAAWEVWDNWSEFKPFQRKLVMTWSS